MFKVHILLTLNFILIMTCARSIEKDSEAQILSNEHSIDEKGNYNFSFETSNGILRHEIGTIMNEGQPNEYISVVGKYVYINSKGEVETVEYIADENGYRILPPVREISLPNSIVATLLGK